MNAKKVFGVVTGIATIVGIGLIKLVSIMDNEKYSDKWFNSLSDDELNTEREKVRLDYCSGKEEAERLLRIFDNEIRRRENVGCENKEYKYPPKREHGWYLPNDD